MIITIAKDKLINGKKARVGDIFKYRDIYLKVIDTTNAEDECYECQFECTYCETHIRNCQYYTEYKQLNARQVDQEIRKQKIKEINENPKLYGTK